MFSLIMITRKRKNSKALAPCTNEKEEISNSLPVLSYENLRSEDIKKINEIIRNEKLLKVVIPKIKIRCEPLNIEKVIDLANNKVEQETELKNPGGKKGKKDRPVKRNTKPTDNKVSAGVTERGKSTAQNKKAVKRKIQGDKNLSDTHQEFEEDKWRKKTKIKLSLADLNKKQTGFVANIPQACKEQSSDNLNIKAAKTNEVSCSSCDNADVTQHTVFYNKVAELPPLSGVSQEELKTKSYESHCKKNKDIEDYISKGHNVLLNFKDSLDFSEKYNNLKQRNKDVNNLSKPSLQAAMESLMNNLQHKCQKENTILKKGLCSSWLSNNYKCFNKNCLYSHNAVKLFMRKLNEYPSEFIARIVVSMRNDTLFVDVVLVAFKILSERNLSVPVWITFLIFFVFYVTEPSDLRFLKFWANAARFFSRLSEKNTPTYGFASLLSIFLLAEKSEEWKIIEFMELIRQPPLQISTTVALLQPVLKLDIPSHFLAEAVESCIATKEDLLKVYTLIVPKISINTSPIRVIELLIKFCETLEEVNNKNLADDLRRKLKKKVLSFKIKVNLDYPLTASFQEEILLSENEEGCIKIGTQNLQQRSVPNVGNNGVESNFSQLRGDFYNLISQAIELLAVEQATERSTTLSPYRNALKPDSVNNNSNKNNKDYDDNDDDSSTEVDVCKKEVTRIKQFFDDCQFDLLGKYLNELKSNVIERAAEEFLRLFFQMKISLQQSVDLIKIVIMSSKSESSAKVIASISVTLILNLVRINEWSKAFAILSLCTERQINLLEGKVFYLNSITQCRTVLLFIEIYAYKEDYLTWKASDETVRVRILEDLLERITSKELTTEAFSLFEMIWGEQKQLLGAVDLRKFINEILILLLNQNSEDALTLHEKINGQIQLNDPTVRAILVTLCRCNRLTSAKELFLSSNQNAYPPLMRMCSSSVIKVPSFWLEEEIFVMLDALFDFLAIHQHNYNVTSDCDFEIQIEISKPNMTSSFRPLCLGIINPTFEDTCQRVRRVLQNLFNPPIKHIVMPYCLKLNEYSVRLHVQKKGYENVLEVK